jgi:hypothetical protein
MSPYGGKKGNAVFDALFPPQDLPRLYDGQDTPGSLLINPHVTQALGLILALQQSAGSTQVSASPPWTVLDLHVRATCRLWYLP